MKKRMRANRSGFTLVEVLIVVVILGILAATVLPQFSASSDDAKESALRQDLQILRGAIAGYKFQHHNTLPAVGTTDSALFLDQMLKSSDAAGNVGEIGTKPLGPYLVGQFAINPYNGLRTVKVVNGPEIDAADDSTGWIYHSLTGRIKANISEGETADGTRLESL